VAIVLERNSRLFSELAGELLDGEVAIGGEIDFMESVGGVRLETVVTAPLIQVKDGLNDRQVVGTSRCDVPAASSGGSARSK
jgi:hypothetical protein